MMRLIALLLALMFAVLNWQLWRLSNARHTIEMQGTELKRQTQQLTQKNGQLITLAMLSETNRRAQARLYATAEQTTALLRQRQRRIEELKHENAHLQRWADTALPADIVRLRTRPALVGDAAYREWLSRRDAVPAGKIDAAQ